jgi:hypothetical protein
MTNQEKRDKIAYEIRALRKIAPKPCFPPHTGAPKNWKFWAGGFMFGMLVALDPDARTYAQVQRLIKIEEPLPRWS